MAKKFLDADGLKTVWGQVKKLDEQNMAMHITDVVVDDDATAPSIVPNDAKDEEGNDIGGKKIILPAFGGAEVEDLRTDVDKISTIVIGQNATFSLSASPAGPIDIGTLPVSIKFTATGGGQNGLAVTADDVTDRKITIGGVNQTLTDSGTSFYATVNFETGDSISASASAKILAVSKSASTSVRAYAPFYYVVADKNSTPTSETLAGISATSGNLNATNAIKSIAASVSKTITTSIGAGQALYVACPPDKSLTNVGTDKADWGVGEIVATDVAVAGRGTYKIYRVTYVDSPEAAVTNLSLIFK